MLSDLSDKKKALLLSDISAHQRQGKTLKQIFRMAKTKYNVKIVRNVLLPDPVPNL